MRCVIIMRYSCSNQARQHLVIAGLIFCFALICILLFLLCSSVSNVRRQSRLPIQVTHGEMQASRTIYLTNELGQFGYISSPNYPQAFPSNITTSASLLSVSNEKGTAIKLTFLDIDLQTMNNCDGEALDIYTARPSRTSDSQVFPVVAGKHQTLCGDVLPEPIIVPSDGALIHLWSDEFTSGQSRGFKLKYEFIDLKTTNGCHQAGMFRCRNRRCILNSLICDHKDDCGDASDEDATTPCLDTPTIPYSSNYRCGLTNRAIKSQYKRKTKDHRPSLDNSNLQDRIVGGRKLGYPSKWPFMVSIQATSIEPVSHICGGSLIHPMFVITAAHCFRESALRTSFRIVLGLIDLRTSLNNGSSSVQVRYAHLISIYPGLPHEFADPIASSGIERANNIALIELNAPVEMTPNVWPVCLAHLSETILANRQCWTAGFGETRGTGYPFSLKQVEQTIVHGSQCTSSYSDFEVDDYHMICVANRNQSNGPCNGDSGGPLVCLDSVDIMANELDSTKDNNKSGDVFKYIQPKSDDRPHNAKTKSGATSESEFGSIRFTLHGVTSFATDGNIGGGFCGVDGVPIIYSRLSTRVDWILSLMKLSMFRLGDSDNKQDINDWKKLFGYMFRTGFSRHENLTRPMTISDGIESL